MIKKDSLSMTFNTYNHDFILFYSVDYSSYVVIVRVRVVLKRTVVGD